jgi:hypothetical protein
VIANQDGSEAQEQALELCEVALSTRLLLRFYARTASVLNPQLFLISFVAIHYNCFS